MIVIVLIGLVAVIGIPKLAVLRDRNAIESAREQLASTLVTAKSGARQRGMPAHVLLSGNVLSAWTYSPTSGDTVWLVQPTDLQATTGVTVTVGVPEDSLISFDTRGFANRVDYVRVWGVGIGARKDSICIGPLGTLYKRNCTQ